MAYDKLNLADGQVLTAAHMAHLEDGIYNSAPAGYGLGTSAPTTWLSDLADAQETGLYAVDTSASPTGVGGWVWVESFSANYKSYTFSDDVYGANCMQTTMVNGVIQPWEWVNPPMVPGVEYRTVERYMNKVVYTKLVNFGHMPDTSSATVKITGDGISFPVRGHLLIGGSEQYQGTAIANNYPYVSEFYTGTDNIVIRTNAAETSYARVHIYYTKT